VAPDDRFRFREFNSDIVIKIKLNLINNPTLINNSKNINKGFKMVVLVMFCNDDKLSATMILF